MLLKQPGFTLMAVVTLALGIGANTAIFSVLNAYLFKPLPVKEPEQLVVIGNLDQHMELAHTTSYLNYLDIRHQQEVFTDAIAYLADAVNLNVDGQAERNLIEMVTGNYFSMLGVEAAHGRAFAPDEAQTLGSSPVMVLSHGFWQRRFGGAVSVIGKTVSLNNQPFTIIGVMPESFPGTETVLAVDAYVPLMMRAQLYRNNQAAFTERAAEGLRVMARLKRGVSLEQARAALEVLARNIKQQHPDLYKELRFIVAPETKARPDLAVSSFIPAMAASLMALVGLILLIACANVANLLLARAAGREKELAIRSALGASRGRLFRLLLVESTLLGILGGLAGAVMALWATDLLSSIKLAMDEPVRFDVRPDWRVFVFAFVVALVTGVAAGLLPSFQSSRFNLNAALKEGGRGSAPGSSRYRWHNLLVVSQVAASLLLLICASLFIRSLQLAQQMDLGFRRDHLLMFSVDVGLQSYDQQRGQRFYQQLVERLAALPQVRAAGLGTHVALGGSGAGTSAVSMPERASTTKEDSISVFTNRVTIGYFEAMGIAVLQGRAFTVQDDSASPRVAIINEAMASAYWPGQSAVGRQIGIGRDGKLVEIVGVVKNSKYIFLGEEPRPYLYLPFTQHYQPTATLFLHTAGDPSTVAAAARQVVPALDQGMPVYDLRTMNTHLNEGLAFLFVRVGATLASVFGLIGLALAVVGLCGVISQLVSQRAHEIAVRLALGARGCDVLRMALKQGMILTLIGVAAGLLAALATTRLMTSLLYGVTAADPLTFAGVPALFMAVALLACWIPARRATKVDPIIALRCE